MRSIFMACALSTLVLGGCARQANVASGQLPLRRVVVYRNGVGYFERAGEVRDERVTFKMRSKMVGDFLATLAIVEQGGSSVRSASFPIDIEKQKPPQPHPEPPDECRSMLKPWPPPEEPSPDPEALREVVLHLDGKRHDLSIGYVAETPVWRPSYRLVVGDEGTADLQTWGIVQNLSGEDWSDVELVLVAGAPIAFQSTLGEPVIPERPIVTDSGEVIVAVPGGVTTLSEQPEAEPSADAEEDADDSGEEEAMESVPGEAPVAKERRKKLARLEAADGAMAPAAPPPPPQPQPSLSAPRRLQALASVAVEGGTTRYALPSRVTVPDASATMVLLLNQSVPGSSVFLFAPDPGVPDSAAHPFRVARFQNKTSGLLERGPIAVFERGSFLGQGVLEPLPPKATATVPFALERSLAVDRTTKYDTLGARLQKIVAGELWVERDRVTQSIYRVRNGGKASARLLIKHPRLVGTRLFEPPEGTEDNIGQGHALVPLRVKGYGSGELLVDERQALPMQIEWLAEAADLAVQAYLGDSQADPKVAAELGTAWGVRQELSVQADRRRALAREQAELEKAARETRLSLKAIEKNQQAGELRQKLTERLRDVSQRMDKVTRELVEVDLAVSTLEVRFRDAIRSIHVVVKPTTKGGPR